MDIDLSFINKIMTAKQKAKELVHSFYELPQTDLLTSYLKLNLAKISALIAVEAILSLDIYQSDQWFYDEVKKEIEKI
jgi:hypothetical protein